MYMMSFVVWSAILPRASTFAKPFKLTRSLRFSNGVVGAVTSPDAELTKLEHARRLLVDRGVDALVVPTDDPHLSEYAADCYNRRAFISGFSGSAGTVVITQKKALLWTDGRYHLQAEQELGEGWELMKAGSPGVLEIPDYLAAHLEKNAVIGIDPSVHSCDAVEKLVAKVSSKNMTVESVSEPNVIDVIWGADRPEPPRSMVRVHPLKYAGRSIRDKVSDVQKVLREKNAGALLVAPLDDVCYLLNLRGADIKDSQVAIAYAIVTLDDTPCTLFLDEEKLSSDVRGYLEDSGVAIFSYDRVIPHLDGLVSAGVKVMMDPLQINFGLGERVHESHRVLIDKSPVAEAKAVKNEAELAGMRVAHVRDGAAVCDFMSWLYKTVGQEGHDDAVSEIDVGDKVTWYRSLQEGFLSTSFPTIAGFGPNGAIIHYSATPESSRILDTSTMFLLDSGAQYLDGTTDVTRTMHLGSPGSFEKECFTRVLKGNIALDSFTFPEGTPGFVLDVLARQSLWEAGLDYAHGTGHGVGAALNVHEGPQGIAKRYDNKVALKAGMILSNEPGFYKKDHFGIRIENLLVVKRVEPKFAGELPDRHWFGFEKLTKIPIQKSLIDTGLMTASELDWLDAYHQEIWSLLAPMVQDETLIWLKDATSPIDRS